MIMHCVCTYVMCFSVDKKISLIKREIILRHCGQGAKVPWRLRNPHLLQEEPERGREGAYGVPLPSPKVIANC